VKIAILTSHLLESNKQVNIHYIYDILLRSHKVDWVTYPISISILRKRNRYKLNALIVGWHSQKFIFNILPKYILNSKFMRKILSFNINNPALYKECYDVLIVEGVQPSYVYGNFKYKNLIIRMSDDLNYLDMFSDERFIFEQMTKETSQIWCVLKSTSERYRNSIYLPNPSAHSRVVDLSIRLPEVVYVGSNKINNKLLLKIANSGIKINIYSEGCGVVHPNIILHELIPKSQLVEDIAKYKVGIIPFNTDDKNLFMEIPLKTYDYIAAGLHVVMISSSKDVKVDVINLVSTHDEFLLTIKSLMKKDVDINSYEIFLNRRSISWFKDEIDTLLSKL